MVRMKGNFGIWLCSDRGLYFWNMCLYVIYLCFGQDLKIINLN